MKKIFYFLVLFFAVINNTLAESCGIIGTSCNNLKKGEISLDSIPQMIVFAANFLIGFAFTISVIFIIIGAYKYLVGGMTGQTDQGRSTIIGAVFGATISACAFLIVKLVMDNFL